MKIIKFFMPFIMLSVFCTDIDDLEGRVNPLDSKGDNWFPPVVAIDSSSISGAVSDTFRITVGVFDLNGKVVALKWTDYSDSIIQIDSTKKFVDSLPVYDSIAVIDTLGKDTVAHIDTVVYMDSLLNAEDWGKTYVKIAVEFKKDQDTTVYHDTISYEDNSDTTYYIQKGDSLFSVWQVLKTYPPIIDTIKSAELAYMYYFYTSDLKFSMADTFDLFVTAIDNYGVESEIVDSIKVMITE